MTPRNRSRKRVGGLRKTAAILSILLIVELAPAAERIITLGPALTEIVFALDKGDRLVGNTKFCDYPEAAKGIEKVGGLFDMNLEVIVDLRPDLIILYPEYNERIKILKDQTRLLVVGNKTLADLYAAIETISRELGVPGKGRSLISGIKDTFARVRRKAAAKKRLKVLLIAGRNPDRLTNLYIIGRNDFLNEVLEIAGGTNAYSGSLPYPNVSIESVVSMDPDFIIELSVFYQGINEKRVLDLWKRYEVIKAVKDNHIRIIKENLFLRPGPRVGKIAEKMYRMFFEE